MARRRATPADDIERYRALILSGGGLLTAVLIQVSAALADGRPLGGVEVATLAVSAVVMAAVYFPANPWVKLASAVAGAIGQTIVAALTDDRVTAGEVVVIAVALLGALGIGALPNAPAVVVADPYVAPEDIGYPA